MHPVHRLFSRAAATTAFFGLTYAVRPLTAQLPTGQQLPSPDQARQLLQTQPEVVEQLRQRLSGLTPDQVHARLRAAGYPENLLDEYLSGSDSTRMTSPGRR